MDETGTNTPVASDLTDVRERVVQLKREIDTKAPADHDHKTLTGRLDEVERDLESIRAEMDVDTRIDEGFENYRELLERLLDRTETIESRLDTLGSTVLAAREQAERREQLASLTRTANREGVRTADCEECSETLDLGLLSDPSCPHCEMDFLELVVGRGLFGTATLRGEQ
jgi:hypothetical protein